MSLATSADAVFRFCVTSLAPALFAICFPALTSPAASNDEARGILFSVRDYQRSGIVVSSVGEAVPILVEPIAFVFEGRLINLPDEPDQDAFARDFLTKGRTYRLMSAGKLIGKATIAATAFDVQCSSLAASGAVIPSNAVSGMRMALASNVTFRDPHLTRRAASPDERTRIAAIAEDVYQENGVPLNVAKRARPRNITAFERTDRTLLIASFEAERRRRESTYDANGHPAGAYEAEYINAVFVIAERKADGPYTATFKWFHAGSENSIATQDLVDVLDLDGTGSINVVTQFGYYEAVEYHVYRPKGDQWEDFFRQFGAGC